MIRAAGIVLWRENQPFDIEILLVHRKQYDDWSFPKGKLHDNENAIAAACRELHEETGYNPILGQYLGTATYEVDEEKKKVKYWMARTAGKNEEIFWPNSEVDRIEWLPLKLARHFLSYDEDREILEEFKYRERHTHALVLLRHAQAIKRSEWQAYDLQRPLSSEGELQAKALMRNLEGFRFSGITTSDAIRCIATVEGLATKLGITLSISQSLNEETFEKNPKNTLNFIRQLLKFEGNQLVCSHNPIIPYLANHLDFKDKWDEKNIEPSEAIVIHHQAEMIYRVDFIGHPTV